MSKRPDIEAVVIPPAVSGVVLLTGAAELVTDAVLDLELNVDYVQRDVTQDGAGITCVEANGFTDPWRNHPDLRECRR